MLQQRSANTDRKASGKPFSLPAVKEAGSRARASGKTIIVALGVSPGTSLSLRCLLAAADLGAETQR